jgi:tol-pal system protein YbgF
MIFAFLGTQIQPAFATNKDELQIEQQLDALQQAVQSLQKTVDTQTAVLKTLIEQANDNVNTMKTTVTESQSAIQQNLASSGNRFDTMATQMQALSESLEEAKARLSKLGEQMAQMQTILTTLPASNPAPAGAPGAPGAPPVPDADSLYTQGLSYYNGGQYDLSIQSFQDYLKYYKDTDRASNAQFYIGECYYSQQDYKRAIEAYDACSEKYPAGNKAAAAQLKKGFSLLALDQKTAGIRELRSLVQRFPDSHEAELARQRLKKLGIAAPASAPTHRKST